MVVVALIAGGFVGGVAELATRLCRSDVEEGEREGGRVLRSGGDIVGI